MVDPDALATEDGAVIGAVEVLHAFGVRGAQLVLQCVFLVFTRAGLFEVEVGLREDGVALHYLVEDVDVQGKALGGLQLLHELAADRAAHAVVEVKRLNATRAKRVPAVH